METGTLFTEFVGIMEKLRAPDGCPWDREQDMNSLRRYILEEAHELVEAIGDGDARAICEECGDVMLQVVFVAAIAKAAGLFSIDDVIRGISGKLVHRHPHVFGDVSVADAAEVSRNWEMIKAAERENRASDSSAMAGIPKGLPALLRALRIQERAAKVGFDWPAGDASPVRAKVLEELDELRDEVSLYDERATEEELGDALFAFVNLSRHLGKESEAALHRACDKFQSRFRCVEAMASEAGKDMRDFSLNELEEFWQRSKIKEKE